MIGSKKIIKDSTRGKNILFGVEIVFIDEPIKRKKLFITTFSNLKVRLIY